MTNLQSFSQTVTDTSFVTLPRVVAEEVIKELLQKDRLEKENEILYRQLEVKQESILNRDEIIVLLESRILTLQEINTTRVTQLERLREVNTLLESELKKERFRKRVYRVSSSVALIGIGAVILYYEQGINTRPR